MTDDLTETSERTCAFFAENLLRWFAEHRRDLPWRRTYHPYHVWISEVMLQQTQMDRVIGYFNKWMRRFPEISTLARAGEDEVMKAWEGLGYYSRAGNIMKTAAILMQNGGEIPANHAELLQLPGIGPYTAGAIMSIAFNRDYPVVDGNVERVLARVFDVDVPVKTTQARKFFWGKAAKLLPTGRARDFNQALMELGALVCMPKNPDCHICPLQPQCRVVRHDTSSQRPVTGKSPTTIPIEMATGILLKNDLVFIQKRMPDDVWANLWEFPGGRLKQGEKPEQAIIREFFEETEFQVEPVKKIITVQHSYMQYRVTLHCYFCHLVSNSHLPLLHAAQEHRWVAFSELDQFAFPAGHRKLIDFL